MLFGGHFTRKQRGASSKAGRLGGPGDAVYFSILCKSGMTPHHVTGMSQSKRPCLPCIAKTCDVSRQRPALPEIQGLLWALDRKHTCSGPVGSDLIGTRKCIGGRRELRAKRRWFNRLPIIKAWQVLWRAEATPLGLNI